MVVGLDFSVGVSLLGVAAYLAAFLATWRRGLDRGLLCLRIYFATVLICDAVQYFVLWHFGYTSQQYKFFYYACDLTATVAGFITLTRLTELAFERSNTHFGGVRKIALIVFGGLAAGSAFIVYHTSGAWVISAVARQIEQNFSFVGMVMAILLFVALNILQVPGVNLRRIALTFSLLYSSNAIFYSIIALAPVLFPIAFYGVPFINLAGPALIAYSLIVPEPKRESAAIHAPAMASVRGASW